MNKDIREKVTEKTKALILAPTCSAETKEAAERWLKAAGGDSERAETVSYIQELEEDIMPIDQLIAFSGSETGRKYFGEETAAGIEAHARKIKEAGGKYCDCPACILVKEILDLKDEMLK